MVDSREKGARAESTVRNELKDLTGLGWERTPGSGALNEKHGLKGDLYIPNRENIYCVEVKHYEDDQISTKILTDKSPIFLDWWKQTLRQAGQVGRKPLLIFKHNRSKLFVATDEVPSSYYKYLVISLEDQSMVFISTLKEWILSESPRFVK